MIYKYVSFAGCLYFIKFEFTVTGYYKIFIVPVFRDLYAIHAHTHTLT